jgi:hypothetical protein
VIGGLIGGLLLLAISNQTFMRLVPWLLLVATTLFALSTQVSRIIRWLKQRLHIAASERPGSIGGALFQLMVAIYGGFFGAGQSTANKDGSAQEPGEGVKVADHRHDQKQFPRGRGQLSFVTDTRNKAEAHGGQRKEQRQRPHDGAQIGAINNHLGEHGAKRGHSDRSIMGSLVEESEGWQGQEGPSITPGLPGDLDLVQAHFERIEFDRLRVRRAGIRRATPATSTTC